jgi:hypothetical protein
MTPVSRETQCRRTCEWELGRGEKKSVSVKTVSKLENTHRKHLFHSTGHQVFGNLFSEDSLEAFIDQHFENLVAANLRPQSFVTMDCPPLLPAVEMVIRRAVLALCAMESADEQGLWKSSSTEGGLSIISTAKEQSSRSDGAPLAEQPGAAILARCMSKPLPFNLVRGGRQTAILLRVLDVIHALLLHRTQCAKVGRREGRGQN